MGQASYTFNGAANSYLSAGTFAGCNGLTAASWSYWVNFSAFTNSVAFIGQWATFANATWYIIDDTDSSSNNNKIILTCKQDNNDNNNYVTCATSSQDSALFTLNKWFHCCWTWGGGQTIGNFKFYINGISQTILINTTNGTTTSLGSNANPYIIGALAASTYNSTCSLAHIGIYNFALSQAQVQEIMWKPQGITSGLVSYIPMVETTPKDWVTGNAIATIGASAAASTSGPPVSFPRGPL